MKSLALSTLLLLVVTLGYAQTEAEFKSALSTAVSLAPIEARLILTRKEVHELASIDPKEATAFREKFVAAAEVVVPEILALNKVLKQVEPKDRAAIQAIFVAGPVSIFRASCEQALRHVNVGSRARLVQIDRWWNYTAVIGSEELAKHLQLKEGQRAGVRTALQAYATGRDATRRPDRFDPTSQADLSRIAAEDRRLFIALNRAFVALLTPAQRQQAERLFGPICIDPTLVYQGDRP